MGATHLRNSFLDVTSLGFVINGPFYYYVRLLISAGVNANNDVRRTDADMHRRKSFRQTDNQANHHSFLASAVKARSDLSLMQFLHGAKQVMPWRFCWFRRHVKARI